MDGRNAYVVDQDSDDLKVIDVLGGLKYKFFGEGMIVYACLKEKGIFT